jgi:hypothetical protein
MTALANSLLGLGLEAEQLALEVQRALRKTRYTHVETALKPRPTSNSLREGPVMQADALRL